MIAEQEYVGNQDQLLSVKTFRLEGGWGDQVKATQITNKNGLQFTVVADRCMDIVDLRYKGINVSYQNPCGVVSSKYYDKMGTDWLRSFTAGFFTTCGLDNIGASCEENGTIYGMHGRIGNTPADQYCVQTIETKDGLEAVITGEMIQSVMFGEKWKLKREIRAYQNVDRIELIDEICNIGFESQEYMILYHCNIGYPFLSPGCEAKIDSHAITPRNAYSAQYQKECLNITKPNKLDEMCYYHEMNNRDGTSLAGIYQPKHEIGFVLLYENHVLDHFVEWKNLSKGQYVLGLEPGSNYVDGKAAERRKEPIKILGPGESVKHKIMFDFSSNRLDF